MRTLFISIILIGLFSCKNNKEVVEDSNQTAIDTAYYLSMTDSIKKQAFLATSTALKKAIKAGGFPNAVDFCSVSAKEIMDSVGAVYGVEIKRLTDKTRNENNALSEEHQDIWNQFVQEHARGEMTKNELIFSKPKVRGTAAIKINNPVCLKCHGRLGEELDSNFYQQIKNIYPNDQAIGYGLGEMRAIWEITFLNAPD